MKCTSSDTSAYISESLRLSFDKHYNCFCLQPFLILLKIFKLLIQIGG